MAVPAWPIDWQPAGRTRQPTPIRLPEHIPRCKRSPAWAKPFVKVCSRRLGIRQAFKCVQSRSHSPHRTGQVHVRRQIIAPVLLLPGWVRALPSRALDSLQVVKCGRQIGTSAERLPCPAQDRNGELGVAAGKSVAGSGYERKSTYPIIVGKGDKGGM